MTATSDDKCTVMFLIPVFLVNNLLQTGSAWKRRSQGHYHILQHGDDVHAVFTRLEEEEGMDRTFV